MAPRFDTREVVRGSAPDLPFDFFSDDQKTVPLDLAGMTIVFTAFSDAAAGTVLFTGTATLDSQKGRAIVSLSAANLAQANVGKWYAELDRKVGGVVKERQIGTLSIIGPK